MRLPDDNYERRLANAILLDCVPVGGHSAAVYEYRVKGFHYDLYPGGPQIMDEVSVILVTAGNEEEAAKIGRTLVEEKLAACANIIPRIRSIYRWKGEIFDEQEFLLLIKTRTSLFEALRDRVRALHSYETPEIVSIPIASGLPEYLAWVIDETGERPS